jgi:hypothetical protein
MIKEICVKVIPHHQQRYPTVGDWMINPDNGRLSIFVSSMENWQYEMLVANHEITEAILCHARGIKEKDVTKFDLWYEGQRLLNVSDCQSEPGDHPRSPYRDEHFVATNIERQLASELNVNWGEYEKTVDSL